MRNITPEFKQELLDGNRAYICRVETDIEIGTSSETLTFTNAELWTGGLVIKDDISPSESSFEALGSVCIGAVTIIINNIDEDYTEIDFKGATIVPYVGLEINSAIESIKLGTYNVEEVTYSGALITLYCIDNLSKFDKPIPSNLSGTMTLGTIVSAVCSGCGVILDTPIFPNYTYTITIPSEYEATTYREVLSYCATIAGCFVKCTANGHIKLDWFDKTALTTAQTAIENETYDGNVTGVHYFESLSSQELGIDDVVITGIQITVTDPDEEATESVITRTYGTTDYVIKIEDNPFITVSNIDTIGAYLQNQLTGLKFRHGSISTLNSPAIEAGDVAIVKDRKGKYYSILITNTEFSVDSYQTVTSAADTPARNLGSRFSSLTKSFVEAKNMVKQEATQRETLEQDLTRAINAKSGMYETREPVGTSGAYIYYLHDKPNLSDSSAVIKITNEAVAVTPNYQASPIQWYGLTVDGTFIANIMDTIGINFDWGTGGTLTLGGQNNQNGILTILDASGNTIGTWDNQGLKIYDIINDEGMNIVKFDPNGAIDTPYKSLIIVESDFERDSTYMSQMVGTGSPLLIYEGTDTLVAPKLTSDEAIDAINTLHYVALKDGYTYSSIQTTGRIASMTVSDTIFAFGYLSENIHIDRDCSDESTLTVTTSAGTITITGQVEYSVNTGKFTQRVYASQSASMPQVIDNISVITDGIHYTYHQYYKVPSYLLGTSSKSVGAFSAGIGRELDVSEDYQYVIGRANAASNGTFIIGNGSESINMYRNAFVIAYSGDIRQFTYDKKGAWVAGSVRTFENAIYDEDGASEYSPETVSKMAGWGLEYFGGASLLAPHNDAYNKFFIKVYNNEEDSTAYSEFGFKRAVPGDTILTIRGGTANSNAYASANPKLEFQNSNASQNIALVFTDFDAVQAPASLTLVGNQGGEYFIAPNIKATSSIYLSGSLVFQGSQGNKTFSFNSEGTFTIPYNLIMPNSSYLYGKNTSGTARNLVGINSSNDYFFGYGGYSNNEGTTYFDGNIVSVRSKNSITITSDTNDVKILGTQMYKYQTATLSANTTYLSACSVTVHRWLNLVMIVGNITHKAVSTPSSANLFSAALNNLYKPRGEVYVMDSIGSYKYKITTSGNFSLVSTTTTTASTHYFCVTYMAQTGS